MAYTVNENLEVNDSNKKNGTLWNQMKNIKKTIKKQTDDKNKMYKDILGY
tara:strand:+ start:582 stop:731 length:150 start_codon:yes stop_codon:yes gene_type:complete